MVFPLSGDVWNLGIQLILQYPINVKHPRLVGLGYPSWNCIEGSIEVIFMKSEKAEFLNSWRLLAVCKN